MAAATTPPISKNFLIVLSFRRGRGSSAACDLCGLSVGPNGAADIGSEPVSCCGGSQLALRVFRTASDPSSAEPGEKLPVLLQVPVAEELRCGTRTGVFAETFRLGAVAQQRLDGGAERLQVERIRHE
jgi:hypothetical protein